VSVAAGEVLRAARDLHGVDPETLDGLASTAAEVHLEPGAVLDLAGDSGDALYVVSSGTLEVLETTHERDIPVRDIGRGEALDDLQTLAGNLGSIVVRAAAAGATLVRAPGADVDSWADRSTGLRDALERMHRRELLCSLHPVLGKLDANLLDEVSADAGWQELSRGEELALQEAIHLVVSGLVEVIDESGVVVDEAGRGDTVGELRFFTGRDAHEVIRAIRPSVVVSFSEAEFERLLSGRPGILRLITRSVVEKLHDADRPTGGANVTVVTVLPLSADVPVTDLCRRLTAALATLGSSVHLDAASVERLMAEDGITAIEEERDESAALSAWLDARESNRRYSVYETDGRDSAWTRRCLRRADRVLLVGHAHNDPRVAPAEQSLLTGERRATRAPRVLVLLHPDGHEPPRATTRWLQPRTVLQHHHVRWDTKGDVERLARFLAGQAVGVALGGGGARGFAHIGCLRALDEAGIPVDVIGGTSMGANIAAQAAMGWSPDRMLEVNRRVWIEIAPQKKYTLPIVSILADKSALECGRLMYDDHEIEDLWLPFYCVSSNLTTAMPVVHRTGSLLWAVTASASLPGIARPVVDGGHLLVDGGLLDNVPSRFLRALGAGTVIASEVTVENDSRFVRDRVPTNWEAVRSRRTRRRDASVQTFPSIGEMAMRAAMLHSTGRQRSAIASADLALRPPVDAYKMTDWESLDELAEAGYAHAKEAIREWRQVRVSSEPLPGRTLVPGTAS
jgi:predicted acylesterase/phospholipase RssA/CRP-like cAMP-binding protein